MRRLLAHIRRLFTSQSPDKVAIAQVTLQDISRRYRRHRDSSQPGYTSFEKCAHCGVLVSGAHNCSPKELRRIERKLKSEEKRAAITAAGKVTIPFPKRAAR